MQTRLPQVDKVLRHPELIDCLSSYKRDVVVWVIRDCLERLRSAAEIQDLDDIAKMVKANLLELSSHSLKKVINGTGVVLNTNLGRAPISSDHLDRLKTVASGYCNLEINLESGKRGKRSSRLNKLLQVLTGAEASLAVNNNAAAVVLVVNCFALGKEVIVSRGELVEIGGSFRVPDVIEAAGAKLREVGTTNKTRLADFENAIAAQSGLIMRCHRSNFELKGFTEETKLEDLVKLCKSKGMPLVEDLGSGVLMNLANLGLEGEPTVAQSIEAGIDLVTFSGDKLLGGPQAGIISGSKSLIEKLAKHPLYRALRLDKVSICLLEQALSAYLYAEPQKQLPALQLIAATEAELEKRVNDFIQKSKSHLKKVKLELSKTNSAIGGGSLPGTEKNSAGIVLRTPWKPVQVAQFLRSCQTPVLAITKEDEVIIDFRTVFPEEEGILLNALVELEQNSSGTFSDA